MLQARGPVLRPRPSASSNGRRRVGLRLTVAALLAAGTASLWFTSQTPSEPSPQITPLPSDVPEVSEAGIADECVSAPIVEPADPTPPPSTTPEPTGPVALVGDSITWEHRTLYQRYFAACGDPFVVVDAVAGRMLTTTDGNPFGPIPSGMAAIEEIERTVDPDVWILQLGVNDVNVGVVDGFDDMQCAIDDVFEVIGPDDEVFWVGPYTIGPATGAAADLTDVLRADPRVTMLDWPAVAPGLVYDGLHATQDGARELADMYCDALRQSP